MENPDPARRTVPWLVFDGDCGFCTTSATWVGARLSRPGRTDARRVPWQRTDLDALGISAERAQREVLWVEPDGTVRGGAAAFAGWLRHAGGAYAVLGTAMGLPGVAGLAGVVYRFVARHRDAMPGGTPACALPPPGADPAHPGPRQV